MNKLHQYENRQRRRQELLQHITSFLKEEEVDEDHHRGKGATPSPKRSPSGLHSHTSLTPPPSHSPPSPVKQTHNMEPRADGHTTAYMSLGPGSEAKHWASSTPPSRTRSRYKPQGYLNAMVILDKASSLAYNSS
ncbi:hypothetical protein SKAU_G00246040 [Synaphobranchus kaupii]|uniref:Uncharacterized protein n=1 Tax=Synaphobranchus kaupii TaxID=118154 RepID=A0A9Q1IPC5_SYNKA|nr:hypothetical protein SKAU_G00246040 [Synaphobranchus kaupii]